MNFNEEILLTLLDKGLLALVLLAASYFLDSLLQAKKANDESLHALAPARAKAYRLLWTILGKVPASSDQPILPEVRDGLDRSMTEWYYDKSGALFLSWQAAEQFLAALDKTRDSAATNQHLRDSISTLRTQLKRDCGIYSRSEARKKLPRPRASTKPAVVAPSPGSKVADEDSRVVAV